MKKLRRWIKTQIMALVGEHNYPTSYQAVDIVVRDNEKRKVLLGRRKGKTEWRFIGGFVDPTDKSLEAAAKRELGEEAGTNLEVTRPGYVGSIRVVDPRYKDKEDQVMTAIFVADYLFGFGKGADDIEEVKWFAFEDFVRNYEQFLAPEHIEIADLLVSRRVI